MMDLCGHTADDFKNRYYTRGERYDGKNKNECILDTDSIHYFCWAGICKFIMEVAHRQEAVASVADCGCFNTFDRDNDA